MIWKYIPWEEPIFTTVAISFILYVVISQCKQMLQINYTTHPFSLNRQFPKAFSSPSFHFYTSKWINNPAEHSILLANGFKARNFTVLIHSGCSKLQPCFLWKSSDESTVCYPHSTKQQTELAGEHSGACSSWFCSLSSGCVNKLLFA